MNMTMAKLIFFVNEEHFSSLLFLLIAQCGESYFYRNNLSRLQILVISHETAITDVPWAYTQLDDLFRYNVCYVNITEGHYFSS